MAVLQIETFSIVGDRDENTDAAPVSVEAYEVEGEYSGEFAENAMVEYLVTMAGLDNDEAIEALGYMDVGADGAFYMDSEEGTIRCEYFK